MNNVLHNDTSSAKEMAKDMKNNAENTAENFKGKALELGAVIKEKSKEAFDTTKNVHEQVFDYVRSNPYKSLGLAFILGIGCAKLSNGKTRLKGLARRLKP